MPKKSFVTSMPDKAGTFLRASQIIASHEGNIVRVSYNKAVDLHMLFIDVQASAERLQQIQADLTSIGYVQDRIAPTRVIEVSVKIPEKPGAVLPVLEVLNHHKINISYMNSCADGRPYEDFKFGLLIEDPHMIKTLLDDISNIYPVNIIECESSEENLDNTVFYIRLANEIQELLGLSTDQTMQFISESNRVLQVLQSEGEDAGKVFDYIRRFALHVSHYRGENYQTTTQKIQLSESVTLYCISPYCGSNTYLFVTAEEITLVDTGYALYAEELNKVLRHLVPAWERMEKNIYITHADVDHSGLLSKWTDAHIYVNQKSAENFRRQSEHQPDFREQTELHMGYSRLSQIISGYFPPTQESLHMIDADTPQEHEHLLQIGNMQIGDISFDILEGSGGHLFGEMIYVSRAAGIILSGDILVNISGFSKERAEFNMLAPFLMKSVNVNSKRAREMRNEVIALSNEIAKTNKKPCLLCGGHGPLSTCIDGELTLWQ